MINPEYVAQLDAQRTSDTDIVKNVWENSFLAFSDTDIGDMCNEQGVPMGVTKICLNAGSSCGKDTKCQAVFRKYVDALKKGYTKDFAAFKKESSLMGYVNIATSIATGFFGSKDASPDIETPEQRTKRMAITIGISVLAVTALSIGIYFVVKRIKNK